VLSAKEDVEAAISQHKDLSQQDVEAGRKICSSLDGLNASMARNAHLDPLPEDGASDIQAYNAELETLPNPTWHNVPWLFSECYMYRMIHIFFATSTPFWQSFDVFTKSKIQSLEGSKTGVLELVKRFHSMRKAIAHNEVSDEETQKAVFEEMVQICLWGNATDLSLLTMLSMEELTSRQGKANRDSSKANIVDDDTEEVWKLVSGLKNSGTSGVIHMVLDNAGFELLTDLVLVGYLVETGYASKVVLHGKRMPWFVSDVTEKDLKDLTQGFINGTVWDNLDSKDTAELKEAGTYWESLLSSGKLEYEAESFWTTAHSFGRMADVEPELWSEFSKADLIIYKGDLNYRKLVYDGCWPHTTPFGKALGPLAEKHGGKGTRTLSLRTSKADVCVGLTAEREKSLESNWTRTGRYAVVSYWDGKA